MLCIKIAETRETGFGRLHPCRGRQFQRQEFHLGKPWVLTVTRQVHYDVEALGILGAADVPAVRSQHRVQLRLQAAQRQLVLGHGADGHAYFQSILILRDQSLKPRPVGLEFQALHAPWKVEATCSQEPEVVVLGAACSMSHMGAECALW